MGMIQTRISHPPRRLAVLHKVEEGIRIPSHWLITNLFVPEKAACPLMADFVAEVGDLSREPIASIC
jgi:hypothetical protein